MKVQCPVCDSEFISGPQARFKYICGKNIEKEEEAKLFFVESKKKQRILTIFSTRADAEQKRDEINRDLRNDPIFFGVADYEVVAR